MNKKQKLWAQSTVFQKIGQLKLANSTKARLKAMWHEARELIQKLVEWLLSHREFCASLMLGIALAYLVHPLPFVGPILATLSVSLSVLYGIALQFKADLDRHFRFVIEGKRI